jgi:hypothetical protein
MKVCLRLRGGLLNRVRCGDSERGEGLQDPHFLSYLLEHGEGLR